MESTWGRAKSVGSLLYEALQGLLTSVMVPRGVPFVIVKKCLTSHTDSCSGNKQRLIGVCAQAKNGDVLPFLDGECRSCYILKRNSTYRIFPFFYAIVERVPVVR
jgi:hypothetical protein